MFCRRATTRVVPLPERRQSVHMGGTQRRPGPARPFNGGVRGGPLRPQVGGSFSAHGGKG